MRLRTAVSSAVIGVVLLLGGANRAQAAPMFGLPDINFAARGDGRTVPGTHPVQFSSTTFTMQATNVLGDSIAIDTGSGFQPPAGFVTLDVAASGGTPSGGGGINYSSATLTLYMDGPQTAVGSLLLQPALVGRDGFGLFKITSGTGPFTVGSTVGLDLHLFNIAGAGGVYTANVKGDLAPVVPEPASLSLLALGLGGLVAGGRRRRAD